MCVGPPASAAVPLGGTPPEPDATQEIFVCAAASDGEFDGASPSSAMCDEQLPGDVEAPSRAGAASSMSWEPPVCVGPPASAAVPLGGTPPELDVAIVCAAACVLSLSLQRR